MIESATPRRRGRRPAERKQEDQYTIRLHAGDRERFDEYAYRRRLGKGDAFRKLLDTAEAFERVKDVLSAKP